MTTYMNLPIELLYIIKTFATNTRLDWRTCKRREAAVIRELECLSTVEFAVEEDPDLLDWTLFGRLYMAETLEKFPVFRIPGCVSLRAPEPMEDYRRWYLLQYRWLQDVGQEPVNRWV